MFSKNTNPGSFFASFLLKLTLASFVLSSSPSFASKIVGLHVVSTGNNKYESEIKANILGMRRALTLVANSMGIKNASFARVPYVKLKNVFTIDEIISQKAFDQKYTADITYSYNLLDAKDLILNYGSKEVDEQFFRYIVIPIFKQKNVISFLEDETEWLKTWIENKEYASKYKLLPIDPTKDSENITPDNLLDLTYEELLAHLKVKRFKNILIASCEYFTRLDGSMYFSVVTTDLSKDERSVIETRYDIGDPAMAKKYFSIAIDQIVARYGKQATLKMMPNVSDISYSTETSVLPSHRAGKAGSVLDDLLRDPNSGKKLKKVYMKADIFSKEGLESFKKKLSKVSGVAKFKIDLNDFGHYILTIYILRK